MTQIDPIIAVADVEASAQWYVDIFGFERTHGGEEFAVLKSGGQIVLCLHKWGEHQHPTMLRAGNSLGNGLLLYFRSENWQEILQKLQQLGYPLEETLHTNPNSLKREFSLRDPDGYYLTVSEFHAYEG